MDRPSDLLTAHELRPAPMPTGAPPIHSARARQRRLLELCEAAPGSAPPIDVDAVARAIARRALFTRRLAEEMRENGGSTLSAS